MKEGLVFQLSRIPLCAVCAVVPAGGPWNLLECRLSQHDRQSHAWNVAKGMTDTLTHDRHSGVHQSTSNQCGLLFLARQTWTLGVSH